jgi:hypothetical protein
MSRRTAAWLAWSVCAFSLALTALSVLLIVLNLSQNAPIYFYWPCSFCSPMGGCLAIAGDFSHGSVRHSL